MSLENLPVQWSKEQLGNLSNFIDYRGKTPTKTAEGIPLITAKNIRDGYINRVPREYIAEDAYDEWMTRGIPLLGDLVITTEAPMGNVAVLNIQEKFALAQRAICLNFKYNKDISRFLYYYLRSQSFKTDLQDKATGTTVQGIKAAELKKIFVPLAPLAEQQEIVRQLDLMLAQVEQIQARLDAIPAILKKFRQSVLEASFNNLEILEKLENLVQCQRPISYGVLKPGAYHSDGIILLRIKDILSDINLGSDDLHKIPKELSEQYKRTILHGKETLISLVGTVGRIGYVHDDLKGSNVHRNLGVIAPNEELIDSEFLNYQMQSESIQLQIKNVTTGANQPLLNLGDVRKLSIKLTNLNEQKLIVEKIKHSFSLIEKIEEAVQSAQKRVNLLTQSILAKAFSGELTAEWREQHQDLITGINSAESLLAKIQAEREASKPVKKARAKKEA